MLKIDVDSVGRGDTSSTGVWGTAGNGEVDRSGDSEDGTTAVGVGDTARTCAVGPAANDLGRITGDGEGGTGI